MTSEFDVVWESGSTALPLRRAEKMVGCLSVFLLLFGSVFAGVPLVAIFGEINADSDLERIGLIAFIGLFGLVGLAIMGWGVFSFFHKKHTEIDAHRVLVTETGLKPKHWEEPLASYLGVLRHVERESSGDDTYTVYRVSLKHPKEKERDVALYASLEESGLDERWAHFAKLLQMAQIEEHLEGYARTGGAVLTPKGASTHLPEHYDVATTYLPSTLGSATVHQTQRGQEVRYRRAPMAPVGLVLIGFGALFFGIPLWGGLEGGWSHFDWFNLIPITIGFAIMAGGLVWGVSLLISTEVLRMSASEVTHYIQYPWGPMHSVTLRRDEIKDIRLVKMGGTSSSNNMLNYLLVISPKTGVRKWDKAIEYMAVLENEHKILLKNYLRTLMGFTKA